MLLRSTLFLGAMLLAGCDGGKAPAPAEQAQGEAPAKAAGRLDRSHTGTLAPAVGFEDPDGEATFLADFRGKPLLLNLWATWCAPCIAEMPTLDALAGDPRIQVLALSQDLEGRGKVDTFFEQRKYSALEPYIDPQLQMMGALKAQSLPTTILYDAEGREVWRMTGAEDWQGPRAKQLIAEALKS